MKYDKDITRPFIIFVIILETIDFFYALIVLLLSFRILIKGATLADFKWGIFSTVMMHRVITAFLKETETIKYFS